MIERNEASASTPEGLTSDEAHRRLVEFGPNAVADEQERFGQLFLTKFWGPIPSLLEAAIVLEIGLGKHLEAAVVGGLLLFNATLGLIQEGRASAALEALKKRLAPTAQVRRDGEWVRLAAAELVPGDIVKLALGALIPADVRILPGSVMVDQSMVTGESIPVEANPGSEVYASCLVRQGEAIAEVTATGAKTYFGRAAELVRVAHSVSTEQRAIFGVTRYLAIVNDSIGAILVLYAYAMAMRSGEVIGLGLTALLAAIPVALPATFTLSAALGAQILARRGVLLTRLSAAHEAAAMDLLCSDKTGTLTRNRLSVQEVSAMLGFDRTGVLALATVASSESDQDPIDAAIRHAAAASPSGASLRLVRFIPFDPATRMSQAFVIDLGGTEFCVVKGAFDAIAKIAQSSSDAQRRTDELAARGHRVIAVACGPPTSLRLAGLIGLSHPPRDDSPGLIANLRDLGVRTVMVTGDSPVTAAAIAEKVGIEGAVCPPGRVMDGLIGDEFGIFGRVVPEEKYRLVEALQRGGHVVGMCGDGANDAPALRQAQIGIAVASATDVAKAAAGMVLTEPGLAGILYAVREGRIAFQRLLTYAFNMLVKKIEIVLFLAAGLALTGRAVITPVLIILLMVTNDFLSMSLTTDRASGSPTPSVWRMRNITAAAVILGTCKLAFSTAIVAFGRFRLGIDAGQLQTLAFVTLAFGNQAVLYALRERRHMWCSRPSTWVVALSVVDVAIVSTLALSGILMQRLPWQVLAALLLAAAGFALILDQVKLPVTALFEVE